MELQKFMREMKESMSRIEKILFLQMEEKSKEEKRKKEKLAEINGRILATTGRESSQRVVSFQGQRPSGKAPN
jgi:hypothetical protein